ncbi:hypothetical protein GOBAR_AA33527 [Gossypium barbadense]|uniref:HhH-GPD domain-containing protein n=1 Tax=Gossypium barbadense TaxID=3634 RepID=A0A2P5W7W5_GOSBA|nr:hypothetical protein GOBAR_AA33527 [Gossypium barbadense]
MPSPPLFPPKIRKLSPDSNSEPNASQQATTSTTSTSVAVPLKTVPRAPKAKLSQHRALVVAPQFFARSLSCEGEVETAVRHLRNADPLLASLIDLHPPPTFDTFQTPFLALTRSILYQQLAFKAGTSIYTRFIALCGGENGVVPETVLSLTPQQLRQIGVSGRKASYLHDLARKYQTGILSDSAIVNMDDKSLFTMLTMVNGIGSWSVHMFMIFSLHRPDVLPINDLGIRKGVQLLYSLEELPRPSQMDQLCEKWRPYSHCRKRSINISSSPSFSIPLIAFWTLGPVLGGNDYHWNTVYVICHNALIILKDRHFKCESSVVKALKAYRPYKSDVFRTLGPCKSDSRFE